MNGDIPPITSLQNPRIKDLVKLRDRKGRRAQGLMLIEEARVIRRAVEAGHPLTTLYACPEMLDDGSRGLMDELIAAPQPPELVILAPHVMEKAAYRNNPEGLLATAPPIAWDTDALELSASPIVLVLESVEKPGNLGGILRSADGAGVEAVLLCGGGVDLGNPNVLRASTGAVFTTPVLEFTLDGLKDFLAAREMTLAAATPDAETAYCDADLAGPVALALGAEDRGLSGALLAMADRRVRIPMRGRADSLNVGVSAAVLAYEALRQRSGR